MKPIYSWKLRVSLLRWRFNKGGLANSHYWRFGPIEILRLKYPPPEVWFGLDPASGKDFSAVVGIDASGKVTWAKRIGEVQA